jgi:ATP-dependent Clp protease ATP-binding subunit ClpB
MEKAHPDVFNVMLQLLDDGRLTDSKGNSVNFRNTLIIFTSNVGSQDILDLDGDGSVTEKEMLKERVSQAMKEKFKPEFLNRIDDNIIFNRLDKPALREIVKLEIKRLQKRLAEKEITISVADAALNYLTDIGFDPVYGARPLKRTIQKELETVVARGILDGRFGDGDSITVDSSGNNIEVYKTFDGGYSNPIDAGYAQPAEEYGNQPPSPADYADYTEDYSNNPPFN